MSHILVVLLYSQKEWVWCIDVRESSLTCVGGSCLICVGESCLKCSGVQVSCICCRVVFAEAGGVVHRYKGVMSHMCRIVAVQKDSIRALCVVVCCSVLQRVAVCCSVLQCVTSK